MTQPTTQAPQAPLPLEYTTPVAPQVWRARLVQWINLLGTFLALIAIFGLFSIMTPQTFPTWRTIENIAKQTTIVGIASMGMTLIIISGGIDLSVGSLVALVTVVIAYLLQRGTPPLAAALIGVGAGGLCGLLNGAVITSLRVVPFIVTLGTLLIFRGVALWIANDQKIDAPLTWLVDLSSTLSPELQWMILPPGVWIMFLLVVLTVLALRFTRFGRYVVAVGSNEQTARLCGIRVQQVRLWVYVVGGLLFGISGVMQFSRLTVGDPSVAVGLELDIIAAVVIGGASLAGGEGSPLGSLVGAAIMTTIRVGSSHMGWPNRVQLIVTGIIIIIAVALDRLRQRKAAAA
jgi:ribose transport system permease protein